MKKSSLLVFLAACLWMGITTPAFAEKLQGMITAIDASNDLIKLQTSGSTGPEALVSVSVTEFIGTNGVSKLNSLDVGDKVSMEVQRKGTDQWVLVLLDKPETLIPAPEDNEAFLKGQDVDSHLEHPKELTDKLKFEMK